MLTIYEFTVISHASALIAIGKSEIVGGRWPWWQDSGEWLVGRMQAPNVTATDRTQVTLRTSLRRALRSRVSNVAQYLVIVAAVSYLVWSSAASMGYNWQWSRVPQYLYTIEDGAFVPGPLLLGLAQTLIISAIASILATTIGIGTAVLRVSSSWSGRLLARVYLELIRNTPLIVQVSLFYFVLAPVFGLTRLWSGILALAFFEGAFASEVFRSGILSIPLGQWEASSVLGLSRRQAFRLVVLPQAVRIMLPPLVSIAVSLIKDSSIVSVIALFELTSAGRNAVADSFMSFEIWLTVAAMYLCLTATLSLFANHLNHRFRLRL
jgi:polar amino acid transport system permease protein